METNLSLFKAVEYHAIDRCNSKLLDCRTRYDLTANVKYQTWVKPSAVEEAHNMGSHTQSPQTLWPAVSRLELCVHCSLIQN